MKLWFGAFVDIKVELTENNVFKFEEALTDNILSFLYRFHRLYYQVFCNTALS